MYHNIILVGNLGRDPEMRYLASGTAVTNFSVAVSDNYTNSAGEKVERTIWVRVSTFGKRAEVCNQYLKKGSKVLVEGHLNPDPATGGPKVYPKGDGSFGASYEINASTVKFLSSKNEGQQQAHQEEAQPEPTPEEELPF